MLKKLLPTCAPMLGEEDYLPNLSVSGMTYALPIWHDYMTAEVLCHCNLLGPENLFYKRDI
jgi:hypothetical protein